MIWIAIAAVAILTAWVLMWTLCRMAHLSQEQEDE